ncbi:ecto-NOX disulfide-thiol exchanger 2 isoform X2 [Patella vulgata]|uniref:ecto-NOX disulfide-thiol exchanger 2 isoform X2 n=1 Tax=Patella vulgata TaxID=6465 RepID=UPI00217F2B07|nr:ecto-NOX disulfide-thiol exchanger 2 isoform X2 [Patella vulgata]
MYMYHQQTPTSGMNSSLRNIGIQQQLNPAMNNMPLMFNNNKGKPLISMNTPDDRKEETPSSTTNQENPMLGGGMMPMGFPGLGFPTPMMGPDPNMMMMGPMMGVNQFGGFMGPVGPGMDPNMQSHIPREIITLKSCSLYPPPPGAPPRSHREKPPGCRTIFIGGLPDTSTEEILTEVFESCGPITSIRLSKKNFAHIRFQMSESSDRALFISGYRMKIENKDDKPNTGRIHVDYAVARDDQYEFECQQRALAREMRHRQSIEEARLRPPSPPPVIHFNDHESTNVLEQLKSDDNFVKASQVLITWLERGDCVRRTANSFFSMIQASNSHVRRLLNEKQQFEEELQRAKLNFRQQIEGILKQFNQIDKIFTAALKQRCWDHFSKAQRKSLDLWNKQAKEMLISQQEEFLNDREEDEMDLSDDQDDDIETSSSKRKRVETGAVDVVASLKEENDSLKCQLEGYKNEIDLIKQDSQNALDAKDTQLKALQNALQAMQQQLIAAQKSKKTVDEENSEKDDVIVIKSEEDRDETESTTSQQVMDKELSLEIIPVLKLGTETGEVTSSGINLNPKEAKLLGLICCFLHVHPFGATVDYLWSYLNQLENMRPREVEDLLERFPMLFKQIVHGVGASIERRWNFCGYTNLIS